MNTTRHPSQIFVKDLQELNTQAHQGACATALDRLALNFLYNAIGRPPVDFKLWDGTSAANSPDGSRLRFIFRTRKALWQTCLRPDPGFGDAYTVG